MERSRADFSQALQHSTASGAFVGPRLRCRSGLESWQELLLDSVACTDLNIAIVMAAFACCFCGTSNPNLRTLCQERQRTSSCHDAVYQLQFSNYVFRFAKADTRGSRWRPLKAPQPRAQAQAFVHAPHHLLPLQLYSFGKAPRPSCLCTSGCTMLLNDL